MVDDTLESRLALELGEAELDCGLLPTSWPEASSSSCVDPRSLLLDSSRSILPLGPTIVNDGFDQYFPAMNVSPSSVFSISR